MFTHMEINAGKLKYYSQGGGSSQTIYAYFEFTILCPGLSEGVRVNQTLLYHSGRKGKREDNQASRLERFAKNVVNAVDFYRRRHAELWYGDNFVEYYGNTNSAINDLAEDVKFARDPVSWESRTDALAQRISKTMWRLEHELSEVAAHWNRHGFLDLDHDFVPAWNVRQKLNELCHAISVDKLHRIHVCLNRASKSKGDWQAEIAGRNLKAKKQFEAPLHLLHNSKPEIVHHFGNKWEFRKDEGKELANLWKQNFYTDLSWRSFMGVPIE